MVIQPSRNLVLKKVADCFPMVQEAGAALAMLDEYGSESWHNERDRVHLAILKECTGDLTRLRELVDLAKRDYRDALVGAEFLEEFVAPPDTPPDVMAKIRERDRAQYEAWLET